LPIGQSYTLIKARKLPRIANKSLQNTLAKLQMPFARTQTTLAKLQMPFARTQTTLAKLQMPFARTQTTLAKL